ncbi:hypothetical protein CHLRE_02g107750v5 [Chlamydomonas reinhardtii]|uniref:Coenzyme Q-binding protein COQ10 START domain-containing protein n=1 Tax=Chlamydomonas reinhardtii TaxID=3055 RepID=A0A2K3E2R1_CHLRE|nr:uncharacterized protein CHLRE_02g107750v5 [Chlamydomonas reinhardtii]PNW87072.1 hypothetical protein CHLRE_02g107750v5 [Chlamydomonas reinhardtii]
MSALRQSSQKLGCRGHAAERSTSLRGRRVAVPTCTVVRAQATSGVRIDVEKTSWNSRRIFAAVSIATPKSAVWLALSDYDNLGKFIPSLVENRCLERGGRTAVLYQVGAQDVAMGVKFSAAVTLRCCEHQNGGLPEALMTPAPAAQLGSAASGSSSSSPGGSVDLAPPSASELASVEALFPYPLTSAPGVSSSDITFELVEGDFQAFRGVWRMQQTGEATTLLSYALFVKPQAWLPVALIQGRIENEVVRNLEAVGKYAEAQHKLKEQQVAQQ